MTEIKKFEIWIDEDWFNENNQKNPPCLDIRSKLWEKICDVLESGDNFHIREVRD
jgi:hypothetical protein